MIKSDTQKGIECLTKEIKRIESLDPARFSYPKRLASLRARLVELNKRKDSEC